MSETLLFQVINCLISLLFAAAFGLIRLYYPDLRHAGWFASIFLLGMLSRISPIVGVFTGHAELFGAISHVLFLTMTVGLQVVLALFAERAAPWRTAGACLVGGLAAKAVTWNASPDNQLAEWLDHSAFVAAMIFAAVMAGHLANARRDRLGYALTAVLIGTAVYNLPPVYHAQIFDVSEDVRPTGHGGLIVKAIASILSVSTGLIMLLMVMKAAISIKSEEAETDTLTRILNRRGFDRRAEAAILNAKTKGHALKLLLFDLDRFKAINDTYGHATGDQVLTRFADILQSHCPPSGIAARIGGEEFIMLIERTSIADAWPLAERIRSELEQTDFGIPAVTVSAGIAGFQPDDTLSSLIRRADQWVYFAKDHGRNQVCPVFE